MGFKYTIFGSVRVVFGVAIFCFPALSFGWTELTIADNYQIFKHEERLARSLKESILLHDRRPVDLNAFTGRAGSTSEQTKAAYDNYVYNRKSLAAVYADFSSRYSGLAKSFAERGYLDKAIKALLEADKLKGRVQWNLEGWVKGIPLPFTNGNWTSDQLRDRNLVRSLREVGPALGEAKTAVGALLGKVPRPDFALKNLRDFDVQTLKRLLPDVSALKGAKAIPIVTAILVIPSLLEASSNRDARQRQSELEEVRRFPGNRQNFFDSTTGKMAVNVFGLDEMKKFADEYFSNWTNRASEKTLLDQLRNQYAGTACEYDPNRVANAIVSWNLSDTEEGMATRYRELDAQDFYLEVTGSIKARCDFNKNRQVDTSNASLVGQNGKSARNEIRMGRRPITISRASR